MATVRLGGVGVPLNLTGALGGPLPVGSPLSFIPSGPSNTVSLPACTAFYVPAGTFKVLPGPYSQMQFLDPVSSNWRNYYAGSNSDLLDVDSDGGNVRFVNATGAAIGALIVNAGTAYTNGIGTAATGLTITPSAGGQTWVPVVGGSIN